MSKKRDDEDALMTVSDASHLLDVSVETVRNYVRRGQLDSQRTTSGYRLFWRSDVERLRDEKRKGPKGKAAKASE